MRILVAVIALLPIGCKSSWDGKSPLVCQNNESLSLKDCNANLPGQVAIRAENNCTLTLTRCTITADTAIAAENNTKLHLVDTVLVGKQVGLAASNHVTVDAKGGRIEGGELALAIDNNVDVTLANTTVIGNVKRANHSTISGLPALEAEQANERLAQRFGPQVCDLAFACYGAKFLGTLAGRYTVELDATGTVVSVQFDGEAPEAARPCLTSPESKRIDGFTGPKGQLECAYSGSIGPNSRRMDRGYKFTPL
jgi:hypothetical protein